MAVLMFFVCLIKDKKFYFNKYWGLYLVFIAFYGLSSFVTGYGSLFFQRLMGDFFVAYTACWATKIYVCKYSSRKSFLVVLMILGVLDAIITIGQVYNWPYVSSFVSALNLDINVTYYEAIEHDLDMTMLVIPGMFRSGVMNGHFLMFATICSFVLLSIKNKTIRLLGFATIFTTLLSSYLTQQRAGFFISLAFSVYLVFRLQTTTRTKYKPVVYFFLIIIITSALSILWNSIGSVESRYTERGLSMTGRETIYASAFEYFLSNPLGGFLSFINERQMYPHNFFLNALLMGGLFGGVLLIFMAFKQLKYIVVKLHWAPKRDIISWIIGLSFIATFIDSLVHNISLANGDILAWLSWTAFYHTTSNKTNIK